MFEKMRKILLNQVNHGESAYDLYCTEKAEQSYENVKKY